MTSRRSPSTATTSAPTRTAATTAPTRRAAAPPPAAPRHYVGPNRQGGNNRSASAGGGPAHCGTMLYLGGAWPAEYRNQMFMGNIHGRRLNVDKLTPQGSGYVATRAQDFLLANDA